MRLSPVCVIGVLIAAPCLSAYGQNTESKDARANEVKGMPPRATPGDYQAHAQAGAVTIAAEFMGHSVPKPEGPLSTEDYVVVETGFFGAPGSRIQLSTGDFSLKINGKKTPLPSQPSVLVTSSLKDPQWSPPEDAESKPKSKGGLSTGGQSDSSSLPVVVHVPIELRHAMSQYVLRSSLPEGDRALPEAGLIFFQYRGRTKSIHSLELIYSGPAGKTTLALQP
ncbi:MAG TPA: hypothetical protein VHZ55_22155 [Bryobacteraceae bacterium]|nr:hypothetical protein [Bryobacteraceae bacterium]